MVAGQFTRQRVERHRHAAARVAFAHDRFQEHRLDEPAVGIGIGEHLAQRVGIVRRHGNDGVFVAVAGQVRDVGFAAGIRIQRRLVGAAVEAALDHDALDRLAGVAGTRIGHGLGVGVDDARRQRDRLGTRVQAQERAVGTSATGLADLGAHRMGEAQLRDVRGHDVGHRLRRGHCRDYCFRRVAQAKHAVAAGVIDHRALQGDDPRAARGQRHIRIGRIVRIEIDEAGLDLDGLRILVQRSSAGNSARTRSNSAAAAFDRFAQLRVTAGEVDDHVIGQASGAGFAVGAQWCEGVEQGHGFGPWRRAPVAACQVRMRVSAVNRQLSSDSTPVERDDPTKSRRIWSKRR